MATLSIIIITKNEAKNIRRCLDSVKFADEIIIVDSGSTDETVNICKEYTNKIIVTEDWPGYGKQKGRALEQTTGDWVLSIDADEEVSDLLRQEILKSIQQTEVAAYSIPVRLIFYGREIKYAVGSDRHIRLFQRKRAKFTDDIIHEDIQVQGRIEKLSGFIYHYSFDSIDTLVAKMNKYTEMTADQKHQRGSYSSPWRAWISSVWIFIRLYFLKRGFLDGKRGLVLAFSFAEGAFYRHMKLNFLWEKK
ncbi:MAG: glycosyltransferase family 2 protein [Proteobacteria bacterium]|nr:glycosyltransferase family 2 protein [Pseudomonadota bacterium]